MKKRFIVLILDGFGIGAMSDTQQNRPGDEKSNTLGSILKAFPDLKLPNLEKLGLMNAYGKETKYMKFSETACFGKAKLKHFGADTFMGHQEIMGTNPQRSTIVPFQEKIDEVKCHLEHKGFQVEEKNKEGLRFLLVENFCTVADNIDADLGMAYNCTSPLDQLSFEKTVEVAKAVREVVEVNRVIPFGGTKTILEDLLSAVEVHKERFIGVHAVKSKSYNQGYKCLHLGYGVNKEVQTPTLLTKSKIPVTLIGKVADIVANDQGKSISCVPTKEVLELTIQELTEMEQGFICTNVQETDLAGHSQDKLWYKELLEIIDKKIGNIVALLGEEDVFLVMADHGNDPSIGHNRHTREKVPLLFYKKGCRSVDLGCRESLSDVGASVCEFFNCPPPETGKSFISIIEGD